MWMAGLDSLLWLSESKKQHFATVVQKTLPATYNFELPKTLRRIHEAKARKVCLQFPEGLLCWAESIALILEEFSEFVEDVFLVGDVTYGACCVDDIKAKSIGSDFLVHYAHSCLIPIDAVSIPCLYVFVEITIDAGNVANHIERCMKNAICDEPASNEMPLATASRRIAILGTIQFSGVVHECSRLLQEKLPDHDIVVPQVIPLTAGETLGCTSPRLDEQTDLCIFIADGRFHLESAMIQNPHVHFLRFDPFLKELFREEYTLSSMLQNRRLAIERARQAKVICVILSTLGRQGSIGVMEYLKDRIRIYFQGKGGRVSIFTVLMSEITHEAVQELGSSPDIAFVQVGCPRLSIDWGHQFCFSLLSPYEAHLAFGGDIAIESTKWEYPMDYFSASGGPWSNYGRPGHRDGSIAAVDCDPTTAKERLREKWLRRKTQIQNCCDKPPPSI